MKKRYHYAPWSGPLYFKRIQYYEPRRHTVLDKSAGWPFSVWVVAEGPRDKAGVSTIVVDIYCCRWRIFHKKFVL